MSQPAAHGAAPAPLASLLRTLGVDLRDSEHLAPLEQPAPDVPTFTVIVRTQGRRRRTLLEALESLTAQTWARFGTIVTVHASGEIAAAVEAELGEAAASGAAPADCRVLHVDESGSRARPLNAGLDAADAPGQIIRARTARQSWLTEGTAEPQTPAGPVEYVYPAAFDQLAHFAYSETPICSLALPRAALLGLGLRFDEELAVCEDWDLLVRASLLLGVHCVDEVTSLYRRSDTANSETEANRQDWFRNRARVIDKLSSRPFVLDGPDARRLAEARFEYGGAPSKRLENIRTRDLLAALPGRLRARLIRTLRLR